MSFDDIPEDRVISYQCPECKKGSISETEPGVWECDICCFSKTKFTKLEKVKK